MIIIWHGFLTCPFCTWVFILNHLSLPPGFISFSSIARYNAAESKPATIQNMSLQRHIKYYDLIPSISQACMSVILTLCAQLSWIPWNHVYLHLLQVRLKFSRCNQIYSYVYSLLPALVFCLGFPKHNGNKN